MILLDTRALVWALMAPDLLSTTARQAIDRDAIRSVSSASLYEIRYKHSLGKWPEVGAICGEGLDGRLAAVGIDILPADGAIMALAGGLDWAHRDPFDCIIVATCVVRQMPLVSKDSNFDGASAGPITRIW